MLTNGSSLPLDFVGDMKLFPLKFHLNINSMANIISFASLAIVDGVTIKLDTFKEYAIYVTHNGNTYSFRECDDGLYFYDTATHTSGAEHTLASKATLVPVLAQTVEDNKSYFSKEEIEG